MELLQPISPVEDLPPPSAVEFAPQLESARPPMFRLLSEIFENVVHRETTGLGFDDWPLILERADAGIETGKALRAVVSVLHYLQENSPATLVTATEVLADGSRYGKLVIVVSEVVQKRRYNPD